MSFAATMSASRLAGGRPLGATAGAPRRAAPARPRLAGVACSYGGHDSGRGTYTYTNPPYWEVDAEHQGSSSSSSSSSFWGDSTQDSYGSTHAAHGHQTSAYGSTHDAHGYQASAYGHSDAYGQHAEEDHYEEEGEVEEGHGYGYGGGYGSTHQHQEALSREAQPYASHASSNGRSSGGSSAGPANYGREDVQGAIASNPLFNAQFMGVLRDSLARQGAGALTNAPPAEPRVSATEEVLTVALQQSKQTLQQLMVWRDQIDRQIAVQQKQVDRMEFALNKSRGDAAYMRALKEMMHGDM